ncbi:MAG: type IX secretion system sortase PorU [Bacteroidota bacterium]
MKARHVLLSAALLFAATFCMSVTISAQQITILSSNASELIVEYRPLYRVLDYGLQGVVYDFERSASAGSAFAGAPDLRSRLELLAFPATEGNLLTVEQVDYREFHDVNIAPIPGMRQGSEVYERGEIYAADALSPNDVARIENLGISRDRIIGEIVFTPVQWNPITRIARVHSRIVCRITFGKAIPGLITSKLNAADAVLLNNGMAGKWAIGRKRAITKAAGQTLASGSWYRFDLQQTGVYRFTRRWFADAGMDVANIDPGTIRIYGNGGRERATRLSDARPDPMQEIAIEVVGGEDGRFDDGDFVQFYGQGLSGFAWNPSTRTYEHYIHRYDDANSYLLTWGNGAGLRMQTQPSLSESNTYTPAAFTGREFQEDEVLNLMNSGKMWVGKRLVPAAGSASSIAYTRKLPGLVRSQPITYRLQTVSSSEVVNSFTVRGNDANLGIINMGTVDFSSDTGDMAKISGTQSFSGIGDLADDRSTLSVTYNSTNPQNSRDGYVDWVEWIYARRFEAVGDELLFSAPDTTAVIQFVLNGFTMSDVVVYDVTDYKQVAVMETQVSGGTVRFQVQNTQGSPRQFLAVAAPALKTAANAVSIPNSGLLASGGADYLIITNKDLIEAANRLKTHRERPGEDQLSSMVVTLESIYNECNAGVTDPTAIRDFLAWAMANWSVPPRYVLFFGDGHFDYRNHSTTEPSMVPVWETENSINRIQSYVTDDYYVQVVGTDPRVDLAGGRLPVQNLDEANTVVDKIISYETDPDFDPWKNRITFVADDGYTGYSDTDGDQHTRQSERLSGLVPSNIEQKKIYIVSYRTENTAQGRRKPDANAAIINQINEGSLIVNYTGHGAHDVWAHERIFLSDVTIPQLQNSDRLTFVAAATCTFGLYDSPGVRSGTELLILKKNGGAVGGLSAPRVVYSGENSAFNQEFFNYVFSEGREADGRARRLGDAIYSTKQRHNGIAGFEKFHLFADPGLRLALPRYTASLERILVNDAAVTSDTVQLRAFSKVTLEGSVRKSDGSVWNDFAGTAEVSLFDAERFMIVPEWNNYKYQMPGGLLYRGKAHIDAGRFAVTFIVPKDISYENSPGRVAIYFSNDEVDGAGYFLNLRVGGSDSTVSPDAIGPEIQLFVDGRDFIPGNLVGKDPLLIADLFDVSGINTTGIGIGHDLEAWLDGDDRSVVLNDYYTGDIDSYQRGSVEFRFRNLTAGSHTLRLRAWDIYNNSTTVETRFSVAEQLTLQDVQNYPNPVSGQTTFRFRHNVLDPVDVDILVYASNGALVRRIRAGQVNSRIVEIPWDTMDSQGQYLSKGIYLYRIVCRTIDGLQGSEAQGRLILLQ